MANYLYKVKKKRFFSLGRKLPALQEKPLTFNNAEGKLLFHLDYEGNLIVDTAFSFDGATPKFRLGFLLFGAWDGVWDEDKGEPQLYEATLKHDALTQILYYCKKNGIDLGINYIDVDQIFRNDMINVNFKYYRLYYRLVRIYDYLGRPSFLL